MSQYFKRAINLITGKKDVAPTLVKAGTAYEEIKDKIRPLDIIVFRGDGFVSKTIESLSAREFQNKEAAHYSHCGLIVTREILDIPELEPERLYIFEATGGGIFGGGVKNIHNQTFIGSQIRDFDDVIKTYDNSAKTEIHWCRLKNNIFDDAHEINQPLYEFMKSTMWACYKNYDGLHYTVNWMQLFCALFPSLRRCRPNLLNRNFPFCSQLVATIYMQFGLFKGNPADVVPADIVLADQDKEFDHTLLEPMLITYYRTPN